MWVLYGLVQGRSAGEQASSKQARAGVKRRGPTPGLMSE